MERVACIREVPGLTIGKCYDIKSKYCTHDGSPIIYLLINDSNEEKWYNIFTTNSNRQLAETTGGYVEYVGKEREGFTIGKYYELLVYDTYSTYYIVNDNGVFSAFLKKNYDQDNFIEVTDMVKRNNILDNLLYTF